MAERVLTERELNRALLARQLLLKRARLPIPRALERIGGIQNQYAPSGYVGLWTRLEEFQRDALTRALGRRSVVQGTLMRMTIHLVSARDYWPFAVGVRRALREWAVRVQGIDEAEVERSREEVRIPPSGTWERRRADRYAPAEEWLGPSSVTEDEGLAHLIRRYLGGFGPAALSDVAGWAGVPVPTLRPIAAQLSLRRFKDEAGRDLFDLPRAPLPDPETLAPVRFLPHWDACLLVHARRTGVLPERHRPKVFHTKNPFSVGVVLVDGRVAGAWSYRAGRIVVEPYERLPRREVEQERARLEAFHA